MSLTTSFRELPSQLPPLADTLAAKHRALLSGLPPVLAASLLIEISRYDWMFPAERKELEGQLQFLSATPTAETQRIVLSFRSLPLPAEASAAWSHPKLFLQAFTAHLWQVHATEQWRQCAEAYGSILDQVRKDLFVSASRSVVVFLGQGANKSTRPLFSQLRKHGTYFAQIDHTAALDDARAIQEKRALKGEQPYAHWQIEGGKPTAPPSTRISQLFYPELKPVRDVLAQLVRKEMTIAEMGPEKVRSYMMTLEPADLSGFPEHQDTVMRHFVVNILCDGSGTQNLSTSFVQWSAREVLRRAQPTTMLIRFAPRVRNADFLDVRPTNLALDANGALIDADIGAYYTWLNLRRLPNAATTQFIAIAENGQGAVAIGPGMSAGAITQSPATLKKIVEWMST